MPKKDKETPMWPASLPRKPAMWTETDFEFPDKTQGNENSFIENRLHQFRNPGFRAAITELRKKYPSEYWKKEALRQRAMSELDKKLFKAIDDLIAMNWGEIQKHKMSVTFPSITHQFRVDAAQLLSDWAISAPGGWRWPEWLICNWDPEKEEFPPFDLEPADLCPDFFPWRIRIDDHYPTNQREVTLTIRSGISESAANVAARKACSYIARHAKEGRPRDEEARRSLKTLFLTSFGLAPLNARPKNLRSKYLEFQKAIIKSSASAKGNISMAMIDRLFYEWSGLKRRKYTVEKRRNMY